VQVTQKNLTLEGIWRVAGNFGLCYEINPGWSDLPQDTIAKSEACGKYQCNRVYMSFDVLLSDENMLPDVVSVVPEVPSNSSCTFSEIQIDAPMIPVQPPVIVPTPILSEGAILGISICSVMVVVAVAVLSVMQRRRWSSYTTLQ